MIINLRDSLNKNLQDMGLGPGGRIQQRVDAAVLRYMADYVPMITGALMDDAVQHTVIGSGEIEYVHPGSRYLYYGEVYGPNIPIFGDDTGEPMGWWSPPGQKKHPTGRQLQYKTDVHPLAGPFWFDRAMADHLNDVIKEAMS